MCPNSAVSKGLSTHGDIFPLPPPAGPKHANLLSPAFSNCSPEELRQVRVAANSLNRLVAPSGLEFDNARLPCERRASNLQRKVLSGMLSRIRLYEQAPVGYTPEQAFSDLVASKGLYSLEPQNLAAFDLGKLRVAKGDVVPKRVSRLLRRDDAIMVERHQAFIERSAAEVAELESSGVLPEPYWDQVLAGDKKQRHEFFRLLLRLGILGAHLDVKQTVGCFFVKKKDGNIRLVVDCRRSNRCHRRPPRTSLGGALGLRELDLSMLDDMCDSLGFSALSPEGPGVGESDVRDAFYQFATPELGSWFAIDERFEAGTFGITRAWSDQAGDYVEVSDSTRVYLGFDAMCMGWSWALHFCQSAVSSAAEHCAGPEQILVDKKLAPLLEPGRPVQSVYVDNFTTVGVTSKDVLGAGKAFSDRCEFLGFTTHADTAIAKCLDTVGIRLDIGGKRLLHKPQRIWRFYLATVHLVRRRCVQYDWLAIWLGHACWIAGLAPSLLSICQDIYPFATQRRGLRGPIPRRIAREMQDMANLAFLSGVDLAAPYGPELYCGDSSGFAWGLITSPATDAEQRDVGRFRERWRFKHCEEPPSAVPTPDSLCNGEGLPSALGGGDGVWLRDEGMVLDSAVVGVPAAVRRSFGFGKRPKRSKVCSVPNDNLARDRRLVYRPEGIPTLPPALVVDDRFTLAIQKQWEFPEHINVLELRVAVSAVQRAARDSRHLGKRLLVLSDNMVAVCLLEKGRSRIRGLNRLCRKAAAYLLATGMDLRMRYLETDRNPADGPSRMQPIGWHPDAAAPREVMDSRDEFAYANKAGNYFVRAHPSVDVVQAVAEVRVISLFDTIFPKKYIALSDHLPLEEPIAVVAAEPKLAFGQQAEADYHLFRPPPGLPAPVATSTLSSSSASSFQSCRSGGTAASDGASNSHASESSDTDAADVSDSDKDSVPLARSAACGAVAVPRRTPDTDAADVSRRGPDRTASPPLPRGAGNAPRQRRVPGLRRRLAPRPGGFSPHCARCSKHFEDLNSIDYDAPQFSRGNVANDASFLELFSGCSRLSSHVSNRNIRVSVPVDVRFGACFDLSKRSVQLQYLRWIRGGRFFYVHLGCPCRAWSIARRGITNETKAREVDELCLQFALFSAEVIRACHGAGVFWSLENPSTSKLFEFGPIRDLYAMRGVFEARFDACQYNGLSKKPTTLLTNCRSLFRLQQKCPGVGRGHQHEPLQGSKPILCADGRRRWLPRTKIAGAYTHSLCRAWSLAIARAAPPTSRKSRAGVPDAEIVAKLHGALPRALGQTSEDVAQSVHCSRQTLKLSSLDDSIAEADLYDLPDASATGAPDLSGAQAYLRSHRIVFGGGRIRGRNCKP